MNFLKRPKGDKMHSFKSLLKNLDKFEEIINYKFIDRVNIITALTHSSYANENKSEKLEFNERLEFLGDAVLNIAISEKIFKKQYGFAEGELTKIRANIVCEPSLEKCANEINIGEFLLLGKGEELTGGRRRTSILSDAFEAVIGAIYIDSGMENAKKFIYKHMKSLIDGSVKGDISLDYKTQLQEVIQKDSEAKISYEVIEEKGPDHNKIFVSQVKIKEVVVGVGEGRSKKEAEQSAAKKALEKL
jgi:ribonuclease III